MRSAGEDKVNREESNAVTNKNRLMKKERSCREAPGLGNSFMENEARVIKERDKLINSSDGGNAHRPPIPHSLCSSAFQQQASTAAAVFLPQASGTLSLSLFLSFFTRDKLDPFPIRQPCRHERRCAENQSLCLSY